MNIKNLLFKPSLFLLMLLLGGGVFAGDATGTWYSTSGSTINLWCNMQEVFITLTTPNGQTFKRNGWWTQFSDRFAYIVDNHTYYGSFVDANNIRVEGTDGSIYNWNRAGAVNSPPPVQRPVYSRPVQKPTYDPTADPAAWNNHIIKNQKQQNTGYNEEVENDPTSDPEAWNNNIIKNQNQNKSNDDLDEEEDDEDDDKIDVKDLNPRKLLKEFGKKLLEDDDD